jgi:hypothetical protein
MIDQLASAAKEIFHFKEMLKDVIYAAMNPSEDTLDKIFSVYQQFVELVESLDPFSIEELQTFLDKILVKYARQPFFPVMGGLFVNALLNKMFVTTDTIEINLETLCFGILDDANKETGTDEDTDNTADINFSLDFLGYLMPDNKILIVKGAVGDYAGALMGKQSKLIVYGLHGKHFGYERDPTAEIIHHK